MIKYTPCLSFRQGVHFKEILLFSIKIEQKFSFKPALFVYIMQIFMFPSHK